VPGFVGEGLTILAGRPKTGKSWLALDIALAVGTGGKAFGSVECVKGDVLVIDLENGNRRVADRLATLLGGRRRDLSHLVWAGECPPPSDEAFPALPRRLVLREPEAPAGRHRRAAAQPRGGPRQPAYVGQRPRGIEAPAALGARPSARRALRLPHARVPRGGAECERRRVLRPARARR
jgi:hypothetical protein